MTQNNIAPGQTLKKLLYVAGFFGVLLTIVTELSHIYPVILELCGGSKSGCADVASTPFAKIFGVSVAYWGLLSYVVFLFVLYYAPVYILPIASAMLGAEFYFMWIMSSIIHIYCLFCLVQFFTVLLLFALTLGWHIKQPGDLMPVKLWVAPVIALIAFTALAAPVKLGAKAMSTNGSEIVTYWGNLDSKLRIEIYSDYQCGYCRKVEPEVDKIMEKNPNILIIFRDYIINSHKISPVAVSYANAVAFTKGKDEYLKVRKELFFNQKKLYEYLEKHLPTIDFTDELKKKIRQKVDYDMERAATLDIYQTPSLVIYRGNDMVQVVRGFQSYDQIARFLTAE